MQAGQAQASSFVGGVGYFSGAAHSVSVSSVDEASITYVFTPVGGGTAITHVAPFTPQPCNMLQLEDGLSIGWMVAGAWIGAYCLLFLRRALSGETGSDYGNT
ncbi:hypothetical protein D3C86_1901120 [compost metagenome]